MLLNPQHVEKSTTHGNGARWDSYLVRSLLDGPESPERPAGQASAGDNFQIGEDSVDVLDRSIRDGAGATLQVLSDSGTIAAAPVPGMLWDRTFDVPGPARYVRAQLVSSTGEVRALSNPVWADRL